MSLQFEAYPDLTLPTGIDESKYIGDFDVRGDDAPYQDLGIAPLDATEAKPGSVDKVVMLAARYAAGLPLWHDNDCYDHGPDGFPADDELN